MRDEHVHVHMTWCRGYHGDDGGCRMEVENGTTKAVLTGHAGSPMTITFEGVASNQQDVDMARLLLQSLGDVLEEFKAETTPAWVVDIRRRFDAGEPIPNVIFD